MKEKVCECVADVLKLVSCEEVLQMMEIPPEESMGDFALPCFGFAKIMRKNPKVIAEELKEKIIPFFPDNFPHISPDS